MRRKWQTGCCVALGFLLWGCTNFTLAPAGSGGAGGTGGGGEAPDCGLDAEAAKSCDGTSAAANRCGPNRDESCCSTLCVPGGTFLRSYDKVGFTNDTYPANVRSFYLDKYEVTVGRYRQFVESSAYPPADMTQGHPGGKLPWDNAWNGSISSNTSEYKQYLNGNCTSSTNVHNVWTPEQQSLDQEALPMNCVNWVEAYAFCLWDGGRLPSEAEWNYAAAGGDEQRVYPWSSPATDTLIGNGYAGYDCETTTCIAGSELLIPGSRLATGDGARWGHADLAGNLQEWVLDAIGWADSGQTSNYLLPCDDCVDDIDIAAVPSHRALRGGAWFSSAADVQVGKLFSRPLSSQGPGIGFRCARDVPNP